MPHLNHKTEACFAIQLGECDASGLSTLVAYQGMKDNTSLK